MSKYFRSTINLDDVAGNIKDGGAKGLRLAVEHLLTEANTTVPHDEGTLERSGSTAVDTANLRGAVGYDTPYAVRQHEDMTLRHDGKGQAKWLEQTLATERGTVGQIIAAEIRRQMGT